MERPRREGGWGAGTEGATWKSGVDQPRLLETRSPLLHPQSPTKLFSHNSNKLRRAPVAYIQYCDTGARAPSNCKPRGSRLYAGSADESSRLEYGATSWKIEKPFLDFNLSPVFNLMSFVKPLKGLEVPVFQ